MERELERKRRREEECERKEVKRYKTTPLLFQALKNGKMQKCIL